MMLTPRDIDLLYILLEMKILTIDQITKLYFPSTCACRNRLSVLRKNGWLEEERPRPNVLPHFRVFKLGKNAFRYFELPFYKRPVTTYLEHRLELNDLYVHLRSSGILKELGLDWQDGSRFDLSFADTHFKPDARLIKNRGGTIYLEYDRGTKNLPIIQENLSTYLNWFDEEEFRARGMLQKIHLIYVTPKESRALAIQRQFETACLKRNQMKPNNFLFHSLTTEEFLEQSKTILRCSNWGQLQLVHGGLGQTNQKTF